MCAGALTATKAILMSPMDAKTSMNADLQAATPVMATAPIRQEVLFASAPLDIQATLLAQMDAKTQTSVRILKHFLATEPAKIT